MGKPQNKYIIQDDNTSYATPEASVWQECADAMEAYYLSKASIESAREEIAKIIWEGVVDSGKEFQSGYALVLADQILKLIFRKVVGK